MRAPPATNNELFVVLGAAAFFAAAILYWQTPKQPKAQQQPQKIAPAVVKKQPVAPAKWNLGGTAPGWASGRWLGEGDFVHHDSMDHPYRHQPTNSLTREGHPNSFKEREHPYFARELELSNGFEMEGNSLGYPMATSAISRRSVDPRLGPR